jgi:hypothetical protein
MNPVIMRIAGAIRAKESKDLAALDGEGNVIYGHFRAK